MRELKEKELDKIYGGELITGSILNAIVSIMKLVHDAGYELGSGVRRIADDEICPLR